MQPDNDAKKTGVWFWLVVATAVVTASLFFFAPNNHIGSDPRYTLLMSRAILQDGTIRLDQQLPPEEQPNYRISKIDGHIYYKFPYGTSLLVAPFVWAAEARGYDVLQFADEVQVQKWLLAGTGVLLVMLCWAILRLYLAPGPSWVLTIVLVWGSVFATTFGSALWNLNLSVLLILASVWLLARHHAGQSATTQPILLGVLLFLAFLCRPTTAVFIAIAFLYLFLYGRRELWLAAGTALAGFLLFLAYNQAVMGIPLPPYYLPQRLETLTPLAWALWGLLFSPSRGLLIFSPVVAYLLVGAVGSLKTRPQTRRITTLLLLWFAVHLVVIARFDHWWGGFSYGPRLLTDAMPAVVWLTAVSWPPPFANSHRLRTIAPKILLPGLAIFSIYANLVTGLYNEVAHVWNGDFLAPNIDRAPQYLFDWRYPQFLATETQLCQRHGDYFAQLNARNIYQLAPYPIGQKVQAAAAGLADFRLPPPWREPVSDQVSPSDGVPLPHKVYLPVVANNGPLYFVPQGWYNLANGRLEAACAPATLLVGAIKDAVPQGWRLHLTLETAVSQTVQVLVNGELVGALALEEGWLSYDLTIPPGALAASGQNYIQFVPAPGQGVAIWQPWQAPPVYFYDLRLTAVP